MAEEPEEAEGEAVRVVMAAVVAWCPRATRARRKVASSAIGTHQLLPPLPSLPLSLTSSQLFSTTDIARYERI